jgi:hypothetical protein
MKYAIRDQTPAYRGPHPPGAFGDAHPGDQRPAPATNLRDRCKSGPGAGLRARIELRTFPRLRFHWDPTPEHADHIEKLLMQLKNKKN